MHAVFIQDYDRVLCNFTINFSRESNTPQKNEVVHEGFLQQFNHIY